MEAPTERVRARVAARSKRRRGDRRGRGLVLAVPGLAALAVAVVLAGRPATAGSRDHGASPAMVELSAAAPDVAGRPWLARRSDDRWEWGEAGRAGRHLLDPGEAGLAVGGRWLVSATASGAVSRLVVRERATSAVVVDGELPFWVSSAAIAGDTVLLTGYGDSSMVTDAGLTLVAIPTGERQVVITGGPFDPRLGDRAMRGEVHVSPGGTVVAVNACGTASCITQVVRLEGGGAMLAASIRGGFLRTVTDDRVILTDGDGAWVKGVDTRSGKERYRLPDVSLMRPVALADGSVVASLGVGESGWHLGSIDAGGVRRELTAPDRERWPKVWPQVSSPSTVVHGDVSFEEALGRRGDVAGRLLRARGLADAGTAIILPGE